MRNFGLEFWRTRSPDIQIVHRRLCRVLTPSSPSTPKMRYEVPLMVKKEPHSKLCPKWRGKLGVGRDIASAWKRTESWFHWQRSADSYRTTRGPFTLSPDETSI